MVTIILVVYKSDKKKLSKILSTIGNKYKIIIVDNSYNYDFSKIKISRYLPGFSWYALNNTAPRSFGLD